MASPSRIIFHVDDSAIALRMASDVIARNIKDCEIKTFKIGQELIDALVAAETPPWMIFCDVTMPGMTGIEVCQAIKRDARKHFVPIVMLTAELDQSIRDNAKKAGAYGYLEKPLKEEALQELLKKYESQAIGYDDLKELDMGFSDEALDLAQEMQTIGANLNENAIKELYRLFHTVKGSANSLQYPHLGQFMHLAEGFLNAVRDGNLYSAPQSKVLLSRVIGYVESQADSIKKQTVLPLPDAQLVEGLRLIKANVDAGWKMEAASASVSSGVTITGGAAVAGGAAAAPAAEEHHGITKSSTSVRVPNEKLNELQMHFKKILQTRTKLSGFANQLKGEFSDEGFPNDLLKMVDQLNHEAAQVMEFFISMRVVPITRLKTFANRVISQATETLNKPAKLDFTSESGLEIDQVILETLENGLTHILRNSVDHGLEKTEKRTELGKELTGTIKFEVRKEGKDQFVCLIQDDGGGINREGLKKAVAAKNLLSLDALNKLTDENIDELIFVDGLSTKTEVTEVSGRGVGLSAVKESIQNLGGTIKVTSEPGKYTRFFIVLPRIFQL